MLFSLAIHTYLPVKHVIDRILFMCMTGCVKCHVYFLTFVFENESCFFLCRVLSFIFYWFGMVQRKLTIPERWQFKLLACITVVLAIEGWHTVTNRVQGIGDNIVCMYVYMTLLFILVTLAHFHFVLVVDTVPYSGAF